MVENLFLVKSDAVSWRVPENPCSLSVLLTFSRDILRALSSIVVVDKKNTADRKVHEVGWENLMTRPSKEVIFL